MANLEHTQLKTARLLLRAMTADDAPVFLAMRCDPEMNRYTGIRPWPSLEPALAMIAKGRQSMAQGESVMLGITRIEDDQLIGTCVLWHMDEQCRRAEIGYGLVPRYWGHGYMHEALHALIDFGFAELNLNRIEADVDPENRASIKALERLGFLREGLLRERWITDGVKADTLLLGLLLTDWDARR